MKKLRLKSLVSVSTFEIAFAKQLTFLIIICLNIPLSGNAQSNLEVIDAMSSSNTITVPEGVYQGTNSTPAILIKTQKKVIIKNCTILHTGFGVTNYVAGATYTENINVEITNSKFLGSDPDTRSTVDFNAYGRAIQLNKAKDILVENNYFENTGGIYIDRFSTSTNGDGILNSVLIRKNKCKNVIGGLKYNSTTGQLLTQYDPSDQKNYAIKDHRQFVQLNKVLTAEEIEISWNEIINEIDTKASNKSAVEDNINIYMSGGQSSSDANAIRIHNNFIKGAYPGDYNNIPSNVYIKPYSGGGILVADGAYEIITNPDNSKDTIYVKYSRAYYNHVVNATNYGIAIAGGRYNQIYNNRVIHSGEVVVSPGDTITLRGRDHGLYIKDFKDLLSPPYGFHKMVNNDVAFIGGISSATRKDWFVEIPCSGCTTTPNTHLFGSSYDPNPGDEINEEKKWIDSVRKYDITVGLLNRTELEAEKFDNTASVIVTDVQYRNDTAIRLANLYDSITFTFNVPNSGYYYIRAKVRSGAWDSATSYFSPKLYWPNGYTFKINNNPTTFDGVDATLSSNITTGGLGNTYWGTMVSRSRVYFSSTGPHTLKVTCKRTNSGIDYVDILPAEFTTGRLSVIDELEESISFAVHKIRVFPNPGKDNFTIKGLDSKNTTTVTIIDSYGTVIIPKITLNIKGSEAILNLNGELSPGFYFFKINSGKQVNSQKVLIR